MSREPKAFSMTELPKLFVFAFGIALAMLFVVAMGAMVITHGEYSFGPGRARIAFGILFLAAFAGLISSRLRKKG